MTFTPYMCGPPKTEYLPGGDWNFPYSRRQVAVGCPGVPRESHLSRQAVWANMKNEEPSGSPLSRRIQLFGLCEGYCAYSMARVSRTTVTLIWPGYSRLSSTRRATSRARRMAERSSISPGFTRMRSSRPACTA